MRGCVWWVILGSSVVCYLRMKVVLATLISVFLCKWEVWGTREKEATCRLIGSLFSLTVLLSRPVNNYTLWIAAFDQTLACFITVAFSERVGDTCWWFKHHSRTVWGIKTGEKKEGSSKLVQVITVPYNRHIIYLHRPILKLCCITYFYCHNVFFILFHSPHCLFDRLPGWHGAELWHVSLPVTNEPFAH